MAYHDSKLPILAMTVLSPCIPPANGCTTDPHTFQWLETISIGTQCQVACRILLRIVEIVEKV